MFLMTKSGRVIGRRQGVDFAQLELAPENGPFLCRFDEDAGQIVSGAFAGSTLERHADGRYSLKVAGSYMCAAPSWDLVEFNRDTIGDWEMFEAVDEEDIFASRIQAEDAVSAANVLWGKCRLYECDPSVLEVNNSFYIPWSPSDAWGLYGSDGACLYDAMTERTSQSATNLCADDIEHQSEGTYIYGGYFNCHFGHFLVDTLPRLWDYDSRGSHKILFHSETDPEDWFNVSVVAEVLRSLNIAKDDVVCFRRPTKIQRLIIPKTSLSAQNYVHKAFGRLCRDVAAQLVGNEGDPKNGSVYLSRSKLSIGTGIIVNEQDLESRLSSHGVDIVHPETMPLAEQIKCLQRARSIIGIAGSALHLSAFVSPRRIVGLSTNHAINSNVALIDAVTGSKACYVYPQKISKVEPPPYGFRSAHRLDDARSVADALFLAASER